MTGFTPSKAMCHGRMTSQSLTPGRAANSRVTDMSHWNAPRPSAQLISLGSDQTPSAQTPFRISDTSKPGRQSFLESLMEEEDALDPWPPGTNELPSCTQAFDQSLELAEKRWQNPGIGTGDRTRLKQTEWASTPNTKLPGSGTATLALPVMLPSPSPGMKGNTEQPNFLTRPRFEMHRATFSDKQTEQDLAIVKHTLEMYSPKKQALDDSPTSSARETGLWSPIPARSRRPESSASCPPASHSICGKDQPSPSRETLKTPSRLDSVKRQLGCGQSESHVQSCQASHMTPEIQTHETINGRLCSLPASNASPVCTIGNHFRIGEPLQDHGKRSELSSTQKVATPDLTVDTETTAKPDDRPYEGDPSFQYRSIFDFL